MPSGCQAFKDMYLVICYTRMPNGHHAFNDIVSIMVAALSLHLCIHQTSYR